MKYFVAACAFLAVHLVGLYLFWMFGSVFERGQGLGGMALACLYVGCVVALIVTIVWKKE